MKGVIHFLSYHNAVPLVFGVLFLGSVSAFAATNPETVYSSESKVVSIDNSYLVGKNLNTYSPRIEVTTVTEDSEAYYVGYIFSTIDIENEVWKDVAKSGTYTVEKSVLGTHTDLGLYVTEQFKQLVGHERERLVETQKGFQSFVTPKVVATTYGGLVGTFLDETTETLPGYTPVVTPDPVTMNTNGDMPITEPNQGSSQTATAVAPSGSPAPSSSPSLSSSGGLRLMGNNPAVIDLRTNYADLGVVITEPRFLNFGVRMTLDGVPVTDVQIDTTKIGEHTIVYTVSDEVGSVLTASRVVRVVGPQALTASSSTP